MDLLTFGEVCVSLIGTLAVILVLAYILTNTKFYQKIVESKHKIYESLFYGLLGGIFCIYATLSGFYFMGALVNIRDVGALMSGLCGGPLAGLIAGTIGGVQRYFMGGPTQIACSLATFLAGIFSGILYLIFREKIIKPIWGFVIAFCMELIHLSLVLVFTKPFETAWTIISGIAPSFLIINPLGLALLFVVINKFRKRIDDDKERHRIETELNVAKHIQASMLPSIFPPYPDKSEFDIFASMSPAKEVGGDLYDFFLVDDDHLGIVMGDVSGKGVPASLFMVITKTLIKDYALSGLMPAEVFNNVNRVLCEGNNEQLFVTAFFGIVTLPTGEFNYVNAGHNPPFIRRNGEGFTELEVTRNTVLAFIEDKKYTGQQTALALGDIIFVYTDGVTEAIDEKDNMYGTDKLAKVLNDCTECSVEELVSSVKVDVDLFVGKAPQFDDITMLALKYIGIKII